MTASTIEQRRAISDRTADRSRESFTLATANQASAAVTVAGGTYLFDATATAWGEVRLDIQRGDGSWTPIASVTGVDRPVEIRLPAGAIVRVVLTTTTGATASLTRVPA